MKSNHLSLEKRHKIIAITRIIVLFTILAVGISLYVVYNDYYKNDLITKEGTKSHMEFVDGEFIMVSEKYTYTVQNKDYLKGITWGAVLLGISAPLLIIALFRWRIKSVKAYGHTITYAEHLFTSALYIDGKKEDSCLVGRYGVRILSTVLPNGITVKVEFRRGFIYSPEITFSNVEKVIELF